MKRFIISFFIIFIILQIPFGGYRTAMSIVGHGSYWAPELLFGRCIWATFIALIYCVVYNYIEYS